jgi:pimeloyl-ACP methyl ester carboxylesterase
MASTPLTPPSPRIPAGMTQSTIFIRDRPLTYTYLPSTIPTQPLLIFINGLMLPQVGWYPTISALLSITPAPPAILTYDRFGQGLTPPRSPIAADAPPKSTHGPDEVLQDMHALLTYIRSRDDNDKRPLVFIANSIGCPLVRLYLHAHPEQPAKGVVLLDSMLANNDFLDGIWPDPASFSFDAARDLPEDVSVEVLTRTRNVFHTIFAPNAPNREGLDRSTFPSLLPSASEPKLSGDPYLIVVGHDAEMFVESNSKMSGAPKSLLLRYPQKVWEEYNQGLLGISRRGRGGVVVAKGCDHFVQRDDPELVAGYIQDMMEQL